MRNSAFIPALCRYSRRAIAGYVPPMTRNVTPEKLDLRLPTEMRVRLDARAKKENRSRNAQAVYYIECGLNGLDAGELSDSVRRIESEIAKIQQAIDLLLRR